ncbi:hypothetical protein [Nocardia beijingensis]|uniref:Uncharacterized protein n=1 Tax=Nocardia beijingensis TaxID=95162 RepID=A0ABW7WHM7_9NOCA
MWSYPSSSKEASTAGCPATPVSEVEAAVRELVEPLGDAENGEQ